MSQRILSKVVSSRILSILEFHVGGGGWEGRGALAWELCDCDGGGVKSLDLVVITG